jgi:type I restriction-modification system DNA methylase subunit
MSNNEIVQKLWNLCDVLRDDGINYADYVTELVLLLFIKMEHENAQSGVMLGHKLPEGALTCSPTTKPRCSASRKAPTRSFPPSTPTRRPA